ncbi:MULTISPECIES: helix-turn-helix domain-containing protein [Hymenobacter]|uniref:Helix-turn-helix domain-containing protein n=1 Tax=Hymenobacter cyanobacteriorum TaxID=2926463 RepID=A0A9X1VIC3_9BACT|nr:helix-turn-helix domain-containing protein [Hymenobacter cyanobacteriorum]MCI1188718.1 helix-turn-helix domain-containing protein [Hymenobacter cyanobacteriorum]
MASKYFGHIEIAPEARQFVERSFLIADQIKHSLRTQGLTQKDLAERLGKKEPEVSRMLTGTHNFTLKMLIRLEQALGTRLVTTPQEVQSKAVAVTLHDSVATDDFTSADWHKMVMFVAPEEKQPRASNRTAGNQSEKAAGQPAAFSVLAELSEVCDLY